MKKICYAILVLFVAWAVSGCRDSGPSPIKGDQTQKTGKVMYNKYNIHVHYKNARDIKAHCANWTGPFSGHRIIPPNTPMVVKPSPRGLILERTDNGEKISFIFSKKYMAMDKDAYIDTIFSAEKVPLDHFSAVDKQGIKSGTAIKGMTKEGVKAALGYPAAHKTPSLNDSEWIFWTNRFGTYAVIFDKNNRVSGTRD